MNKLTIRQQKALHFIQSHTQNHGCAPTLRELCQHMGYKAVGSAQDVIASLRKKGYLIQPDKQVARSLILTDFAKALVRKRTTSSSLQRHPVEINHDTIRIPILGSVPAGNPVEAIEDIIGSLSISPSLLPRPLPASDSLFALRASGLSMIEAGILDGDWLVIRSQNEAPVGSIVVARVGEEATVKRLMNDPQRGWYLKPENRDFRPLYADEEAFEIVGKMLALQRTVS